MSFKNKLNLSNKKVLYSFIPIIDTHTHTVSLQNKPCLKSYCEKGIDKPPYLIFST